MTSKIVVNNIEADSGINTVTFNSNIQGNFVGNVNTTGVSTFSNTVNVGAGKSIRIFGSASGYSDIIAPTVAGDQTFTLPGTGGTLDRLNRAGNILQVVSATYSTEVTSSVTAYADTGLTASITPSSSSSKVLVIVHQAGVFKSTGNAINAVNLKLFRGLTELLKFGDSIGYTGTTVEQYPGTISCIYLDSPNTTSSTSYKTQFANVLAASLVSVQRNAATSTITLMEIAA